MLSKPQSTSITSQTYISLRDKRLKASLNHSLLFFLSPLFPFNLSPLHTNILLPPSFPYLLLHPLQLVGGEFDLETNFIIQEAESIGCMVELLSHCEVTCQAEIWSMFTAILRKSVRNLQTSTEVGLIQQVLLKMSTVDDMIAGKTCGGSYCSRDSMKGQNS